MASWQWLEYGGRHSCPQCGLKQGVGGKANLAVPPLGKPIRRPQPSPGDAVPGGE